MSILATTPVSGRPKLTPLQMARKKERIQIVNKGLATFTEVGIALFELKEEGLYKDEYGTWDEFTKDMWGFGYGHAWRLIKAAEVASTLSIEGPQLQNEVQTRPIRDLDPRERQEAVVLAFEQTGGRQPTEAEMRAAAATVAPAKVKPLADRLKKTTVAELADAVKDAGLLPADVSVTVVLPEEPTEAEPEPETPRELTDVEWLETLPARSRLSGRVRERFDADALAYRAVEPFKDAFREATHPAFRKAEKAFPGRPLSHVSWVQYFLKTPGPTKWKVCEVCGGKGIRPIIGECPDCRSEGYYTK